MELKNAVADPIHIFNIQEYVIIGTEKFKKILVRSKDQRRLYYLNKNGEEYNPQTKYSIISQMEKSFELVHPSILNLSGFSIQKPYLFYEYIAKLRSINDMDLSNENIQILFLGIASGISYLLSKGYNYSDFSIDSIIIDEQNRPLLVDYVSSENSNENAEEELIIKYFNVLDHILYLKKRQNPEMKINDELIKLFERCQQKTNLPNFHDFVSFFNISNFCSNEDIREKSSFKKYIDTLWYADKYLFFNDKYYDYYSRYFVHYESIEKTLFYMYNSKNYNTMDDYEIYLLNYLPEFYIKRILSFLNIFSDKFIRYCYNEDLSLACPNLNNIIDSNYYKTYNELKKQIQILEKEKNNEIYFTKTTDKIDYKIEAIRIQAIDYLKKAVKQSNDAKVKIELAMQYIQGEYLPYNLTKALDIVNSIANADDKTNQLIIHMKEKINSEIESMNKISHKLSTKQKEKLQKAEQGEVLYLLFLAFSFYTGYDEFPVLRSLSIQYYRTAARKSPYAMTLLGYLYFNGVIFPQNLKRARNCFKRAADSGYSKAEIIDGLIRKHIWRTYLLKFDINDIITRYLPSLKSMIPSDSYTFPKINYYLDSLSYSTFMHKIQIKDDNLPSDNINENYGMFLTIDKAKKFERLKEERNYSEKILLSSEINENSKNVENQLFIAKSYFNGDNNFPVNYSKAKKFFKLAADGGNSEAQWRYAMMLTNSDDFENNIKKIEKYFRKSIKQKNLKANFLYALFMRYREDNVIFEQIIEECCNSEDLDAMYYYGMHFESKNDLDRAMSYYIKSAEQGHFDSLIRLIGILKIKSETKLYEDYLKLSVAILNEPLLVRLITFYDRKKEFDKSNILIQIGIKMNYRLFNAYYSDHLLYGKGMEINIERAKKIAILAYNENYQQYYLERYTYIVLELLLQKNEHKKAAEFLLNHKNEITPRFRRKFLLFYKNLDKNVAKFHFITVNYIYKQYQICHTYLMKLRRKERINLPKVLNELIEYAKKNPYAMAILGKLYKQGKYVFRDLKKAIKYFALSAKNGCPLGYYYLGKEYFYGRLLNQDFDEAKEHFIAALKNLGEPRAGYYLFKLLEIRKDKKIDAVECLKTSASFGFKNALYKYGNRLYTGKNPKIPMDKEQGINLIKQSAYQNYTKAKKFCKLHGINLKKGNESKDDNDIDDEGSLELNAVEEEENDESQNSKIYNIGSGIEDEESIELNDTRKDDHDDSDITFWL